MADQPASRRRFQFRLRTLMIGVTLLAVPCGFATLVARNQELTRERDEAREKLDAEIVARKLQTTRLYRELTDELDLRVELDKRVVNLERELAHLPPRGKHSEPATQP